MKINTILWHQSSFFFSVVFHYLVLYRDEIGIKTGKVVKIFIKNRKKISH